MARPLDDTTFFFFFCPQILLSLVLCPHTAPSLLPLSVSFVSLSSFLASCPSLTPLKVVGPITFALHSARLASFSLCLIRFNLCVSAPLLIHQVQTWIQERTP